MKLQFICLKKISKMILGILCALFILIAGTANSISAANIGQIPVNTSVSRSTGTVPKIYKSLDTLITEVQNSTLSSTEKELQIYTLNNRKNNAITQSDINTAFSNTVPTLINTVFANPTAYGFDSSEFSNSYIGESFGYFIYENNYITDDDTVKYYPICYNRQIIGILTLTKTNGTVTCKAEKSFINELTSLLIQTSGGNAVLLKNNDTIYGVYQSGIVTLVSSSSTPSAFPSINYNDVCGAAINTVNAGILNQSYTINDTNHYQNEDVRQFISRLYEEALQRTASSSEITSWANQLINKTSNGAQVAYGFIFSEEFTDRDLNDSKFLDTLYSTMFDRNADYNGKAYWLKLLSNGLSREYVFKGFTDSQEFTKLCKTFNINKGSITLSSSRDQNSGITMFVYRCYAKALDRTPDINGLNNWCRSLLNYEKTPRTVAYGFIFSDEMKYKNLSNTEFTKVLYRVFLDREYDTNGLNFWVSKLNSGVSKDEVFNGFASSQEFASLVSSYGL